MHNYLRSIGFRDIDNKRYHEIIQNLIDNPEQQFSSKDKDGSSIIENITEYDFNIGISTIGKRLKDSTEYFEYTYPYYKAVSTSSNADVELVRNSSNACFSGILEDGRLGIDLIFHVIDQYYMTDSRFKENKIIKGSEINLSGLAEKGMILLPVSKCIRHENDPMYLKTKQETEDAARNGDTEARELIAEEEYEFYNHLQSRVQREDIYTILQTYIMPLGIENDKYEILGEISDYHELKNRVTGQNLVAIDVKVNSIPIQVVINEKDLVGEIEEGRRFKGTIWLQGSIQ